MIGRNFGHRDDESCLLHGAPKPLAASSAIRTLAPETGLWEISPALSPSVY